MDTRTPVVVLYRGNQGAYGIARSLGELGIPLYLVTQARSPTPLSSSRYWREVVTWDFGRPEADTLDLLASLGGRLAERHGAAPLLLTATDWAAIFIEANADELARHFLFPRAARPVVRELANKWTMARAAEAAGVPTPATVFPQSSEEAEAFVATARFPVVAKAADAYAGHAPSSLIAHDAETLREKIHRESELGPPNLVLQEYIPGEVSDVWMCNAYFGTDGGCRAIFTGRKLRQLSSTGIATLAVCEQNEVVAEQTRALLSGVGYRGCTGVGYRYDPRDGLYKLLDVNARISGVFRLFRATNGMDVVRTLYLDLTGQPTGESRLDPGRKWLLEDDLLVSLPRIRRGELRAGPWLRSFRGVREAQWFTPRDPLPFLVWLRTALARFLRNRLPTTASAPSTTP
jgi:predicted ATP-grasp superfamily ATP-dependent carboligase